MKPASRRNARGPSGPRSCARSSRIWTRCSHDERTQGCRRALLHHPRRSAGHAAGGVAMKWLTFVLAVAYDWRLGVRAIRSIWGIAHDIIVGGDGNGRTWGGDSWIE